MKWWDDKPRLQCWEDRPRMGFAMEFHNIIQLLKTEPITGLVIVIFAILAGLVIEAIYFLSLPFAIINEVTRW